MPATQSFLLPDLGEGLTEAELITWFVQVGDTVELNQVIAEVETAKASVELPSPYAGTVTALRVEAGTTVNVGAPIIDIDTGDDGGTPIPDETEAVQDAAGERVPVLVGYGVAADGTSRRRRRAPQADPTPPAVPDPLPHNANDVGTAPQHTVRTLAKPPVRFLAAQNGIDLSDVPASGPRGEVTRTDVTDYLAARTTSGIDNAKSTSDAVPAGETSERRLPIAGPAGETRTPIKGVRKHTATAMVASAFTAPHVTEFVTIDITPTLELLGRLRAHRTFADVRLTPLALVAKALLVALKANPSLNSHWDDDAQEIVTKHYVNLGIAAATPRGLMVPNIKNAHRLGLRELADELMTLTGTAKDGKTGPADLADGTITITNVGVFGVDAGTPILNPGEAAILCFGAVRTQPWEYQGEIALRSVTTLSLSFDHRLVDGEQGSKFLATIGRILSDPLELTALA